MRVLFVTHNAPRFTGDPPGSFLLRLAVALRAQSVDVEIIAPHAPGLAVDGAVDDIPIHRVRYAPDARETLAYGGTMAQQVGRSWLARRDLVGLIAALRRETARRARRIDVIHAHWWFPAGLATAFAARARTPMITTLHGSDVRLASGPVARRVFRAVARRSARVTAASHWLAAETVRLTGAASPLVAPMPVDTALFTAGTAMRQGVLFVGKLDAQKGLRILLRAFAAIDVTHGPLTVVGDGPDAASLRHYAVALGVADRIRWLGPLPQPALASLYQGAAVVALPATAPEGLGLVAVEAQLCGAPVVASAIGGLVDVVGGSTMSRLVPPGDADALAGALTEILRAPAVAEPSALVTRFQPDRVAATYAAIYEEVLHVARA